MTGMLRMLNAWDRPGFASTSTLTTSTVPSYLAASFSISGATILHGPHHAAQKSTTTGRSDLRTSSSKFASVATLISAIGIRCPFLCALARDVLDETIRLDDPRVRETVVDRGAFSARGHETCAPQHREMLAHVGDLAADPFAQIGHRQLADGERFEDAQAFRVRQRSTDRRITRSV